MTDLCNWPTCGCHQVNGSPWCKASLTASPVDQITVAMALPAVRVLLDALRLMVNHAEWRENNEGVFWEATNHARNALAPFGKATE